MMDIQTKLKIILLKYIIKLEIEIYIILYNYIY